MKSCSDEIMNDWGFGKVWEIKMISLKWSSDLENLERIEPLCEEHLRAYLDKQVWLQKAASQQWHREANSVNDKFSQVMSSGEVQ